MRANRLQDVRRSGRAGPADAGAGRRSAQRPSHRDGGGTARPAAAAPAARFDDLIAPTFRHRRIDMKPSSMAGAAGLLALACALSTAIAAPSRDGIAAALTDRRRPATEVARDPTRHPAELIRFAGIKPGDRVADYFPGGGYYDRILSDVVGPKGRVYGFIPA